MDITKEQKEQSDKLMMEIIEKVWAYIGTVPKEYIYPEAERILGVVLLSFIQHFAHEGCEEEIINRLCQKMKIISRIKEGEKNV